MAARKPKPANDNATLAEATAHVLSVAAKKSKASRSGIKGESIVAALNLAAEHRGVATLQKIPTATRRVKRGKTWAIAYVKKSTVDYCGMMLDGSGRHVALEVKTCTSKKTFYMREVELHQRAYLDKVHLAGGVAALVIVFGPERTVHVIPWDQARDALGYNELTLQPFLATPETYLRIWVDGLVYGVSGNVRGKVAVTR